MSRWRTIVEITRKRALENARLVEELRSSEARLHAIVAAAMDAIITIDETQRVILFNAAAERMFGVSADDAIGSSIDRFLPARFRAAHERHIQGFAGTGVTSRTMGRLGTLVARRADDSEFPIEATISRVTVGGRRFLTVIVRDVTERRQAEDALRDANRRKDEFLAMLGHELRNPLAPILTALRLMAMKGDPRTEKERAVIERQVNHLRRLVDDLLDVSRITRGKLELKKQRVELGPLVDQAIEITSPLIEERRHRLEVEIPPGLEADVDPVRFTQVLANLLANAAGYTEPAGRIAVRAQRLRDEVCITVTDTGIGIKPELLGTIWDPFVQSERTIERTEGGLGLGLALVRSITELHGGRVVARSEGPGRGSEFEVRLPVPRTEVPESPSPGGSARPPVASLRVLVVDDNTDAADLLGESLRTLGHEVQVAYDGPQALETAARFPFEVAVVDIGLPVMDGYEVARRLQELAGERSVRLIALTGYGQESARARSRAAGFAVHLTKPVGLDDLERAILGR